MEFPASRSAFPDGSEIFRGRIPDTILPDLDDEFEAIWNLHPREYKEAVIHGRVVKMPRWVRAYEKDYPYSNQVARAQSAPPELKPFLEWSQSSIDERHNGLLLNWHDGELGHHHGKHRDSEKGLIPGHPIVTISLGEDRVFRMRPYRKNHPREDILLSHGDFIIIPWETNRRWTHEVPNLARFKGRRISVTIRAFE